MGTAFLVTNVFASDADGSTGLANDYFQDAQPLTLPVQVSGSIGYADDYDIYSFTGQAGQILTALLDTTQLATPSSVDSILQVYDSDFNQIAYNDQEGLAPGLYLRNDSFIQMVLPSTGTYYVAVFDFLADVGDLTNYKYALHLKLR